VKESVKKGLMPYIADYLLSTRAAIRKQIKNETDPEMRRFLDAKQYALKGMAVSLYGYNAFAGGKLYTPDVAAAEEKI
jgi:DNA polymerase elongation subunit (family B)